MTTKTKDIDQKAKNLFNQLVEKIPRDNMWPVIVGLMQHALLDDNTSIEDYHYGAFAVTDTLRDAAKLQKEKGEAMELDIMILSNFRKSHL